MLRKEHVQRVKSSHKRTLPPMKFSPSSTVLVHTSHVNGSLSSQMTTNCYSEDGERTATLIRHIEEPY